MTSVAIIGAGAMGQALAHILQKNQSILLSLFDKDPSKMTRIALPLPKVVAHAEAVFLCVPSWAMREALSEAKPYLKRNAILVSLAKGIEGARKKPWTRFLRNFVPRTKWPFLVGRCLPQSLWPIFSA